ncbi:MAG: nucleoside hydrolase [Nocardioidaceae bacterium]
MRRILVDTDLAMGAPGSDIDDGFALALALADPELRVELVSTVNGNTDVDNATRLTLELLERLGRSDVPVVRGAASPLVRTDPRSPVGVATVWPPGTDESAGTCVHAAATLVERVMSEPGELTLVAIGPLTNVALAMALEPRFAGAVAEVVVMGGVYLEHTNVAAMPGEFNFWVDPDAVAIVLGSGASLSFVGLDVTRKVRLTREHASRLADGGGNFACFAAACTHDWISHLEQTTPGDERDQGSCALHDPLAVAVVSRPDLVTWRSAHVEVEREGERTRGVAVADLLMAAAPPAANCRIATDVDVDAFTELFLDRIGSLP